MDFSQGRSLVNGTNVIPLLLGDINNLYPRIFSPAVLSFTLIEKSKILLICVFFLFLSIGLERGDMTLNATIFYSFCRRMQRPMARADPLLSQLPLSTCEDNCPFFQKATSIYLENLELNSPPIDETNFISGRESKICWC